MKTNLLCWLFLAASFTLNAQVGIGVTTPTQMLEVDGGDVYVNNKFYINSLPAYDGLTYGPDKFRIVAADKSSEAHGAAVDGRIMEFVGNQEIMPIIIQPYQITGVSKDNLRDLDLNISTSKYVISICNFQATPIGGSLGIYRKSVTTSGGNTSYVYDNFVIRAFESAGKWHVEIRAREADPQTGSYEYNFDIVLFPKRFFRNLGTVPYDLDGENTGAAASPPSGI